MSITKSSIARRAAPLALAALLIAAAWPAVAGADGKKLTSEEVQEFNNACGDTGRAGWAIARLRHFLSSDPDSAYALFARRMIVRALLTMKAPGKEITAAADTASALLPSDPRVTVFFYGELAQMLLDRKQETAKALGYARTALADVPADAQYAPLRAAVLDVVGRAQLANGFPDSAVTTLKRALPSAPDSQKVLTHLGDAYAKSKKTDLAINAYLRALGVYMSKDSAAAAPLRELWRKKHGSLGGLEAEIAALKGASRKRIALDGRRDSRPAPAWKLTDLDGKPVAFEDFKGKVVVMNFWGSWCGPCRVELPIFQAVYERYKSKGVVFLGMNYERPVPGKDLKQLARDFIEKHKYTFPVVLDHEHVASDAYRIEGFPTTFLIDKAGTIRYKNVGVADGIEMILQDQIESLLN